jgi:hypothetical protein
MPTPYVPLQPPPRNLDKLTLESKMVEMIRWMYEVYRRLQNTGLLALLWTNLTFTGSKLVDILDRKHADLQNILGNDPTSTDATKDKHVSNAQSFAWTKGYQVYRTTAVGLTLAATDEVMQVTAICTIVVPTAVGVAGKPYKIDNNHAGAATVNPTGAETIEGEVTQVLTGQCCMDIYSDGVGWRIQ